MAEPSMRIALEDDVAYLLLLWLAIHGGDPAQHGRENAFTVSSETYNAAIELVGRLAEEFSDTRLADHTEIADRMQAHFGVSPDWVSINQLVCYQYEGTEYCFRRPLVTKAGWTPTE